MAARFRSTAPEASPCSDQTGSTTLQQFLERCDSATRNELLSHWQIQKAILVLGEEHKLILEFNSPPMSLSLRTRACLMVKNYCFYGFGYSFDSAIQEAVKLFISNYEKDEASKVNDMAQALSKTTL